MNCEEITHVAHLLRSTYPGRAIMSASSTALERYLALAGVPYTPERHVAEQLDAVDPLRSLCDQFSFPTKQRVWPQGRSNSAETPESDSHSPAVYLAGNSLGLMPKSTPDLLRQELDVWSTSGVLGHTDHEHSRPWIRIDEHVTPILAEIVGALPSEVACMGSLTANLHALLTSFYKPTASRHKIMFEGKAFPSDQYAFASQIALRDFSPDSLLRVNPRDGEYVIRNEDILRIIEEEGDSIAVICFGAVQYYSAEFFDMEAITRAGHAKGCIVGFDCAHAVGNVPMNLHAWDVDFACWCSYKYLNSGPGGIAGLFVHERHADQKRLAGWWGHDVNSRFAMSPDFNPMPGAAGWQMSNPSVLDVVSLLASLRIFKRASELAPLESQGTQDPPSSILSGLRDKSMSMTAYLERLLQSSAHYLPVERLQQATSDEVRFTIITPFKPERRGAQLSLLFHPVESMDVIFEHLRSFGVLGDERRPGVIRLAPVPLYNTFRDCWDAYHALELAFERYQSSNLQ